MDSLNSRMEALSIDPIDARTEALWVLPERIPHNSWLAEIFRKVSSNTKGTRFEEVRGAYHDSSISDVDSSTFYSRQNVFGYHAFLIHSKVDDYGEATTVDS